MTLSLQDLRPPIAAAEAETETERTTTSPCKTSNHLRLKRKLNLNFTQTTTRFRMPNKPDHLSMGPLVFAAILLATTTTTHLLRVSCDDTQLVAPLITRQPQDIVAFEGEAAELSCEARGQPEPQIEWFHNERLVVQTKPTIQIAKNALRFQNLVASQDQQGSSSGSSPAGQYYCLATNALGQVRSRNATLKILSYRSQSPSRTQQPNGSSASNQQQQQQQGNFGDLVAIGAISLLDPQAASVASDRSNAARLTHHNHLLDASSSGRLVDRIAHSQDSAASQPQNKLDYIIEFMRQNKLSKFCDLLTGSQPEVRDLNRRLNAMSQFTLFVPTNEALLLMPSGQFEQITKRPEEVRQFLLSHATNELVVPKLDPNAQRELLAAARWSSIRSQLSAQRPDLVTPSTARASSNLVQSLAGTQLRVTTTPITTTSNVSASTQLNTKLELIVNGANVLSGNSHALQEPNNANVTYAIVHLIDRPLYPAPSATLSSKLRQLAPRMGRYLDLAQDVTLNDALESSQRLSTLFLPSDDSFKLVPEKLLSQLETNRTFLMEFLRNHLVDDLHYSIQLSSPQFTGHSSMFKQQQRNRSPRMKLSAMSNLELEFELKNFPSRNLILVNSIPIIDSDQMAVNGVVHLIARPIFEQSIVNDCNCTSSDQSNPLVNGTASNSIAYTELLAPPAASNLNLNTQNGNSWSNSMVDYVVQPANLITGNELEREETQSSPQQRVRSQRSGTLAIERNNRDFYRPSVVPANLQLVSGGVGTPQRGQQVVAAAPVSSRRQDISQDQMDELNRLLAASSNQDAQQASLFEAERYKVLNATTRQRLREQQEWQNYTSSQLPQTNNRFAYDRPLTTQPTIETVTSGSDQELSNSPGKRLYSSVGDATGGAGSTVLNSTGGWPPLETRRQMLKFQAEDARDLQPTNRSSQFLAPASSFIQPAYETIPGTNNNLGLNRSSKQFTSKTLAPPSGFNGCAFYDADCKRLVSKLVRLPPTGGQKSSKNLLVAAAATSSPFSIVGANNFTRTEQHLDSTFGEGTESPFGATTPLTPAPAKTQLTSNQFNRLTSGSGNRLAPQNQPLPPWSDQDDLHNGKSTLASGSWNHRPTGSLDSDITRIANQQQSVSSNSHAHGFTGGLGRLEAKSPVSSQGNQKSSVLSQNFTRPQSAQILLVPVRLLQNQTSGSVNKSPQLSGQLISEKPIYFSPPLNTIRIPSGQQQQLQNFNSLSYHIPTPQPLPLPGLTIHTMGNSYSTSSGSSFNSQINSSPGRLTNFTAIETIPVDEPLGFNNNQFQSSSSNFAKNLLLKAPVATQRKSRIQQQQQQEQLTSPARKIVRLQPSPSNMWPSGNDFNGDISITSAKLSSVGDIKSPLVLNSTSGGLAVQASNQSPNAFIRSVPLIDATPFESAAADRNSQASDFFQNRTIAEIMEDSGLRIDGQQVTFSRLKECLKDAELLNLVTQIDSSLTIFMPTDLAFQRLVQQQAIAHQRERSLSTSGSRSTISGRLLDPARRHLIPLIARTKPLSSTGIMEDPNISGRLVFDPIDSTSATQAAERLTLDCSTSQVRQLLLDHLSARLITPKQLQNDLILSSLNGQHQLILSSVPSKKIVVVDGQPVIAATRAKNGMVYVVNKFLNLTQQVPNVIDLMESQPNLTTFLSYLNFSSLTDRLKRESGPITVLAPTNEAFEQLSSSARQLINSDPAALLDILRGHVVEGAQFGKLISMRNRLKTMNSDQSIEAKVIKPNVYQLDNQMTSMRLIGTTGNGVVNAIDRLIVPPWLKVSMGNKPATVAASESNRIMPLGVSGITAINSANFGGELDGSLLTPAVTSTSASGNLNLPLIGRQPTRFEQPAGSRLVVPPSRDSATNSFLFSNSNSNGNFNRDNNLLSSDFDVNPDQPSSFAGSSFLRVANATGGVGAFSSSNNNATRNMQLIDKLANLMQARKFTNYLFKSRVSGSLKPDMNYVILVPTDQAIEKLPRQIIDMLDKDPDRLLDLVNYHILDTTFEYINTIPDGQTLDTINSKSILFNWHRNNTILTASGAVVLGGIQEDNIALLIVDRVLYPTPGDILNIISKSPILSNFTSLVRSADLAQQLSMAGPYTLFAPSDFAFNQLDKRDLEFLQRDKETARRFLLRHLSQPAIFTSSIALSANSTSATTGAAGNSSPASTSGNRLLMPSMTISNSLGEDLTLRQRNDYFSVNDVNFSYADVAATNGVVHVIDGLL